LLILPLKNSFFRVAGKQGFLPRHFYKLFYIKQLRDKCLKTHNFIFSFLFVCFAIFSYFLPWNGHKMDTSLSEELLVFAVYTEDIKSYIHSYRRESIGLAKAALMVNVDVVNSTTLAIDKAAIIKNTGEMLILYA
jgi:hypothetical protein